MMFESRHSSLVIIVSEKFFAEGLLGRDVLLSLVGLSSRVDLNCLTTSLLFSVLLSTQLFFEASMELLLPKKLFLFLLSLVEHFSTSLSASIKICLKKLLSLLVFYSLGCCLTTRKQQWISIKDLNIFIGEIVMFLYTSRSSIKSIKYCCGSCWILDFDMDFEGDLDDFSATYLVLWRMCVLKL